MSDDHATTRDDERLAELDDYVRGRGDDVDAFEEALFTRALAGEAPELALHDALSRGVAALAGRGTLDPWITASDLEALRARHGARLAVVELGSGGDAGTIPLPESAEVVVTRIPMDLRGVERVDVEALTVDGTLIKTMLDARFDPADGALFACCEAELARIVGTTPVRMRAWAVRGSDRRLVREAVTRLAPAG